MSHVHREVLLPAPPGRVWEALSDPRELSVWFGAEASIDLRPRGQATFRWPDGSQRVAVVETVEEPRLMVFRWLPFVRAEGGTTRVTAAGRVRIGLEPYQGGTRLTVVETVATGPDDSAQPTGLLRAHLFGRPPLGSEGPVTRGGVR